MARKDSALTQRFLLPLALHCLLGALPVEILSFPSSAVRNLGENAGFALPSTGYERVASITKALTLTDFSLTGRWSIG